MLPHSGATRHPKKTWIYVKGRRYPIGYVLLLYFYKNLKPEHFLTNPPAIAFDRSTLVDAEKAGALYAHITNSETGTVYTASIADIWRHGFPVLRGFGQQIALALPKWNVNGQPAAATFNSNAEVKAAQPSLFAEVER